MNWITLEEIVWTWRIFLVNRTRRKISWGYYSIYQGTHAKVALC